MCTKQPKNSNDSSLILEHKPQVTVAIFNPTT